MALISLLILPDPIFKQALRQQGVSQNFNTLDQPKVQKFLSWVKKQKPDKRVRAHRKFSQIKQEDI